MNKRIGNSVFSLDDHNNCFDEIFIHYKYMQTISQNKNKIDFPGTYLAMTLAEFTFVLSTIVFRCFKQ